MTALRLGLLLASFRNYRQPELVLVFLGFDGLLTAVDNYYNKTDLIAPFT